MIYTCIRELVDIVSRGGMDVLIAYYALILSKMYIRTLTLCGFLGGLACFLEWYFIYHVS